MRCPTWLPTRSTKSFSTQRPPARRRNLRTQVWPQTLPPKESVCSFFSWQIPRARGLAHLFERGHVGRERLAIRKLVRTVSAFRIEIIEQACGAAFVRILADVPRLDRLIDVAPLIELNDLLARLQIL